MILAIKKKFRIVTLPDNMLPVAYFAAGGEDDGVLHQLSHDGVLELLIDVNIEYARILRQLKK